MPAGALIPFTGKSIPSPTEQREFLSNVIERIVVNDTSLEVAIIQPALREAVLGKRSAELTKQEPFLEKGKNVLKRMIEARVKRWGGEVRLLVPTDSANESRSRPVPLLVKAVARAHRGPEQIIHGELKGRLSIARCTGLDERYIGRVQQCALLAPDIVEAILDGRQPADLGIQKLLRDLPLDWAGTKKTSWPSRQRIRRIKEPVGAVGVRSRVQRPRSLA